MNPAAQRLLAISIVIAGFAGTAEAQLFGGGNRPNRFVTVTAAVDASASEVYAIVPGVTAHVCYPGAEPVPGQQCSDSDTLRSTTPGDTLIAHADIRPPIDATQAALVESEGFARQDLDVSRGGDLRRATLALSALNRVIGPNSGSMTALGDSSIRVGFRVQSFLRPTTGRLEGVIRVRASDPVNPFFNPPYRPGRSTVSVELLRVDGPSGTVPLFTRQLDTDASAGQFIEIPFDEPLTLANGRYTLSVVSDGQVTHFGGGFAGAAFGRTSFSEGAAELVLTLDNAALRR